MPDWSAHHEGVGVFYFMKVQNEISKSLNGLKQSEVLAIEQVVKTVCIDLIKKSCRSLLNANELDKETLIKLHNEMIKEVRNG